MEPSLDQSSPLSRSLGLARELRSTLAEAEARSRVVLAEIVARHADAALPLRQIRAEQTRLADGLLAELAPRLDATWQELEEIDGRLTGKARGIATAVWRAEVVPYFLRVPLVRRSMDKPLGYAGDYGMVRIIFDDPDEGTDPLATALTRYTWDVGPCRAHRDRRPWALSHLRSLQSRLGRPLRVVSYACGPEHTLQAWVREAPSSQLFLYDAEPRALEWAGARFASLAGELGRPISVRSRVVTAQDLVEGRADVVDAAPADAVLVLGLFDYLQPDAIAALVDQLVSVLRPGGRLLCTNVAAPNPWRTFMEYVGSWQVQHRTVAELTRMVVHGRSDLSVVDARLDASGTNAFLAIERAYGV